MYRRGATLADFRGTTVGMNDTSATRDHSVDWARGLAAIAMIEGHATQAWTSSAAKQSVGYAATRVLAACPLPAFLLLAGMALHLRLSLAQQRGELARVVQANILRRGVVVVGWGYAVSAAYAAMDGHDGLRTFLRADVLHVIGLSIIALALVCVDRTQPIVQVAKASRRALLVSVGVVVLSPVFYRFVPIPTTTSLRYLIAPFVRVPKVTVFPLLPMLAWAGCGFVWRAGLVRASATRWNRRAVYGLSALVALAVAIACDRIVLGALDPGQPLDDLHPAGMANVLGYAARGAVLIAVAPLVVSRLPRALQAFVTRFGRASLVAYVFHIPFCYGVLGAPLRGRLSLTGCVPYVVLLIAASYAVVVARNHGVQLRGRLGDALRVRAAERRTSSDG